VKFTEAGSVEIRAEVVSEVEGRTTIRFEVTDTGIGIDPDHQEVIFNAFEQVDGSTTREFGGTGIGLAICARLVSLMEGQIALTSVLGEGSTFEFTVPFTCTSDRQLGSRRRTRGPACRS
jgi:hypothetical protein